MPNPLILRAAAMLLAYTQGQDFSAERLCAGHYDDPNRYVIIIDNGHAWPGGYTLSCKDYLQLKVEVAKAREDEKSGKEGGR